MVAAWKAAGFTYNRYLAVAARTVRRCLKDEHRIKADRREQLDLKFSRWSNGKQGEAQSLVQAQQQQRTQN